MSKNFCYRLVPFILFTLTLACVSTKSPRGSGHLVNYSSLKPDPEVQGVYIDKMPKKNPEQLAAQYTAFIIDPIIIYFHPDTIGHGVNPVELKRMTDYFRDGLIQNFSAKVSPETVQYNTEVWQKFVPWCKENHPDEYSKMFKSEGRFIYNRENGAGVVQLLRKWREEQKDNKLP